MDGGGCTANFTDEECKRFLKPAQILLLDKLRSEKAVDDAALEGLTKCPFCPWACVIENPGEGAPALFSILSGPHLLTVGPFRRKAVEVRQ